MPPINTIVATEYILPTYVFQNGQVTDNPWNNADNMLLVDGDVANSNVNQGVSSDITVGGYNFQYNGISIPQGAVIVGIEMKIIGYRGAQTVPDIELDVSLYDNTDGADDFYPYISGITSLTTEMSEIEIGTPTYLFASSFTVDQINNAKFNLTANGDISLDSFLARVYFYIPSSGDTPVIDTGVCEDCDSPIQVQAMYLELPFLSGETKFYLKKGSFAYPNGVPVQPGDVGECGGVINFVFDQGKKKADGNFEENVRLDTDTGTWTVLTSGVIEVDIDDVENRGLDYKTPGDHVAANMSDHDANSEVIISNNTPYNLTLVRRCQADTVFSPPIDVEQEDVSVVDPVHTFNFKGAGVTVEQDGTNTYQANIIIPGAGGTNPPMLDDTSSETSGSVQVPSLTWEHTVAGVNRALVVEISLEGGKTVSSVTFNGDALTFSVGVTNGATRSEIWYMVAPDLGTHDIVVTFSADSYSCAGAESWVNVDQTTPIGDTSTASGTSTTPSVVVNTLYDNSVVIDGLSTALTPILLTPGAGQTENWHHYANTDTRQGASSLEPAGSTPDAVTMSYAITQNTAWSLCAVELKGITVAGFSLTVRDIDGTPTVVDVNTIRFPNGSVTDDGSGVVTISFGLGTQTAIQFKDEGVNLGTTGTVDTVDFAGAGVTATRVGNVVTVTIPGGGAGLDLEVNGTPNVDQTLLNLIAGTGITLTDDGAGGVTIEATGGASGGGGDSKLKVGVGSESNTQWYNTQLLFTDGLDGGGLDQPKWAFGGSTNPPRAFDWIELNDIAESTIALEDWAFEAETGDVLATDDGKLIIIEGQVRWETGTDNRTGWGLGDDVWSVINETNVHIGIGSDENGDFFASNADGITKTTTALATLEDGLHTLRIEVDSGNATPQIRFFVDGVLVATHTTNLPSDAIAFSAGNNGVMIGGISLVSAPCVAFELENATIAGAGIFVPEQNLGSREPDNDIANLNASASSPDGEQLYAIWSTDDSGMILYRFQKDPNTGSYYKTHSSSISGIDTNGVFGIVVIGAFVYVLGEDGSDDLIGERFSAADLTGATAITTAAPAAVSANGSVFTDGIDIYVNLATTTWTQFTISGTVLTIGSAITGGMTDAQASFYDLGKVYMVDIDNLVNAYSYGGGAFTLLNGVTYDMFDLGNSGSNISVINGFAHVNSSVLYMGFVQGMNRYTGSGSDTSDNLYLKAFTKPDLL